MKNWKITFFIFLQIFFLSSDLFAQFYRGQKIYIKGASFLVLLLLGALFFLIITIFDYSNYPKLKTTKILEMNFISVGAFWILMCVFMAIMEAFKKGMYMVK